jgi:hypothetical protein
LLKLPKPVFIVLYNGEVKYPEQATLKLSDAFKEEATSSRRSIEIKRGWSLR